MNNQDNFVTILKEINELNHQRFIVEAKLSILIEKVDNLTEDESSEKYDYENEIKELNSRLNPLIEQIQKLQCRYRVSYQLWLSDPVWQTHYWSEVASIELRLQTCCEINTLTNGWDHYRNNSCVIQLLQNIHEVLFQLYGHTRTVNIARIHQG